jgi:hypothetical protein
MTLSTSIVIQKLLKTLHRVSYCPLCKVLSQSHAIGVIRGYDKSTVLAESASLALTRDDQR